MKAMQVEKPGAPFTMVERSVPEPGPGQVRIQVRACGICHSDAFVKEGHWPGIDYPRVPGHEITGVIDAVGDGVQLWKKGDRVGVGWHGGHCFICNSCRKGDFILCQSGKVTGISQDGGYAEYMVAPAEAVARLPDALDFAEAGPLLCAGITVYNGIRNIGALAGDVVAVQGIGGLGHLALQYARQMGFHTVALSRGQDKRDLAEQLGAHTYIDSERDDAVAALQKLGGARVIVATAPNSKLISSVVDGLAPNGALLLLAASPDTLDVTPIQLLGARRRIVGWPSGHAFDSEETLRFSALSGVRPMIEKFPLAEANAAYERMITNKARFRVVLEP